MHFAQHYVFQDFCMSRALDGKKKGHIKKPSYLDETKLWFFSLAFSGEKIND